MSVEDEGGRADFEGGVALHFDTGKGGGISGMVVRGLGGDETDGAEVPARAARRESLVPFFDQLLPRNLRLDLDLDREGKEGTADTKERSSSSETTRSMHAASGIVWASFTEVVEGGGSVANAAVARCSALDISPAHCSSV